MTTMMMGGGGWVTWEAAKEVNDSMATLESSLRSDKSQVRIVVLVAMRLLLLVGH